MYRVTTWDNLGELDYEIEATRDRMENLGPLGEAIAELLAEDNRESRLAGLDRTGAEFTALSDYMVRRREREGSANLTPFVGKESGSTIIREFRAEPELVEPWLLVVTAGWPGVPWVRFHVDLTGARTRLPLRDFVGITPGYDEKVHDLIYSYLADALHGG